MIHKIQSKNFIIDDVLIIDFLRSKSIEHLRFNIAFDNITYISVQFPNYDKLLVLGKSWQKITYGRRKVYIRTPSFLRKYSGKEIEIYKENEEFSDKFEAFRIKPIGFSPYKFKEKNSIRIPINFPYFSHSGYFVVTKNYITEHSISINNLIVSFNKTDLHIIQSGFIFCTLMHSPDSGELVSQLVRYSNGLRTTKLNKLINILLLNGKQLNNYSYLTTIKDKSKHEIIIFKEKDIDDFR